MYILSTSLHVYTQLQFLAEHKSACSYTASVPPEHKSACSYTASVPPEHKSACIAIYTDAVPIVTLRAQVCMYTLLC